MNRGTKARRATSPLMVDDLTRVYVQERDALIRRATRKVQDSALAEDIVQEAFFKCMLAAPEIADIDHLAAYLNTAVTNLCTSHARAKGVRPDFVAIDAQMDADQVAALLGSTSQPMDDQLVRAEDSALVREAISRLNQSDRSVLMAEAFEGLTAPEIASRYGMKIDYVYTALARARKNLRVVLEEWVVDEETGATAAQLLSKTYRKVADNSKKFGSAALSLILLVSAFFGFWNNPTSPARVAAPQTTKNATTNEALGAPAKPSATSSAHLTWNPHPSSEWALDLLSKTGPLGWPGLDAAGLPVGFTVNNGAGLNGLALITQEPFVMDTDNGTVTTESRFTTFQDGLNVIIAQKVVNKENKLSYSAEPMVRVGGSWFALDISEKSTDIKELSDGTYLITSWMIVDITKSSANAPIAGAGLGTDLVGIPAVIATRLRTTAIGQPVIGQAVQVLNPLMGRA